jgi:glucose-6-phosphate 1-dehydrogenase
MAVSKIAQKKPDPCSFVIFGVTGDLTHRLVIPALYNLAASDLLPDRFCLVGVARKGMTSDRLRDSLMKGLRQYATRQVDDAIAQRLLACVTCVEADPKDPESFDAMSKQLDELETKRDTGGNRLFYLATPPNAFLPISRELARTGMLAENGAWRRLVVEKPFGTDLASARRQCRISWCCASPMACSSRSGTVTISTTSRSPSMKNSASGIAAAFTTRPARCATWCRTICSSCCRWSRWSRR